MLRVRDPFPAPKFQKCREFKQSAGLPAFLFLWCWERVEKRSERRRVLGRKRTTVQLSCRNAARAARTAARESKRGAQGGRKTSSEGARRRRPRARDPFPAPKFLLYSLKSCFAASKLSTEKLSPLFFLHRCNVNRKIQTIP